MANYEFFTDETGKNVKVSNITLNIPCYFSSSNSALSLSSKYVTASNGVAQTPMIFKPLSSSSENITVTAYGLYTNGNKTNEASTTIQLKNALQGIRLSRFPSTPLYTSSSAQIIVGAVNDNVYGLDGAIEVTLSATSGTMNGRVFTAPKSLNSASYQNVTITANAAAGKYSYFGKTGTVTIEVRQAVTNINTDTIPTIYLGDGDKRIAYTLSPTNCYLNGVTLENYDNAYYTASAYSGQIMITPKAVGSAYLKLKSADGKCSTELPITISNRGNASINVNKTSITLNPNQVDNSITVTSTGCTLSVSSNGPSIATAKVQGNNLVITAGTATGTTQITISGTPSAGYTKPADVTVNVTVKNITIAVV